MNLALIVSDSAPAIAITSGLTQAVKAAFPVIQDKFALITTVVVGLLVTGAFDYALVLPATPQDWTIVVLHGFVVGLSAAGLYKTGAAIAAKARPGA